METTIDSAGRVVIPKAMRGALGMVSGTKIDISFYGAGIQLVPHGRTARIIEENGVLVGTGSQTVDDDIIFALIDAGRR